MTQLEKWQPKRKISTARNRKAREGYMNIGHHSGRQNLAHGVIEQMEKGDTEMPTHEQARLESTIVQLEKIAGLGAVAGAAKKAAGAVSGAAKKVASGGDNTPTPKKPNFYETANVSRGKGATSRDWKVQSAPAINTSPYGKEYERVRTDVTEAQRAQRTGEPMRAKRQPVKQSGGGRLSRAFGASKRGVKRGANWLVDDLRDPKKMEKALPPQSMEKVVLSLQKVADGDLFIQKRGRSKEQQMAGLARAVDRPEDYAEQMRAREIYHEGGSIRGDEEYGPHAEAQKRGGSLTRARRSIRAAQMEGAAGDVEGHKDRILGEAERRARDHGIPIQNGVVDKLTGGRVKFETNRDKQVTDRGPKFLGVPSVEVQVKKPTMKMTRAMKMGAGYKKLEKSADGDCGCSD